MKKFTLLLVSILLLNSCGNDDNNSETPNKSTDDITVESTNVKTFELVNLTIQNSELLESYQGTFGNIEITINKVDETKLAFLVPDITQGSHTLNFVLGNKEFNVTKTTVSNPQETISNVFNGFNTGISNLDDTNPFIENEIQNAMSYFSEVEDLYNSLSDEQKIQVALYYEANKETFQRFVNNTNIYLDASTILSRVPQSQCLGTSSNFKSFYGCTAENLGEASLELTESTIEVLTMLGLAGLAIAVSPATVAISLGAAGIAIATAVYILLAETVPAAIHFKNSLREFMLANWIFTEATFDAIVDEFSSETETSANSQPTFRSLNENDEDVSTETSFLINSLDTLDENWNSLSDFFPSMPSYQYSFEIIAFDDSSDQMVITNISNPNVELVSVNGQNVTFKSLSGEDETFSFDIEIIKEGFSLIETINNATVYEQGNNFWAGTMTMTSDIMIQDCDDTNGDGQGDCGTGGCQSGHRAIFGSSWGTSGDISFTYSDIQQTNNFVMGLTVGGSSTVYRRTCYTANIQPNTNFTVAVNYYAPDSWGIPGASSLQNVNFIITNQSSDSMEGTWSGNIRVVNGHCLEQCSGTWQVSSVSSIPNSCDVIPSNP